MNFKVPGSGQQIELTIPKDDLDFLLDCIGSEVKLAEASFPAWPEDLNYGDQIVNEEKGEATKALLDICQGKACITDAMYEYVQTAAMCIRQVYALKKVAEAKNDPINN